MNYDIFREELAIKYPDYGHALWKPSPAGRYTAVEIGDVGFIREGYFHRLFNILLPADHESHRDGVPQHHEPLVLRVSSPTNTDTLQPNNLRSYQVLDTSDEHRRLAAGPDDDAQFSFTCSRRRGAVLDRRFQRTCTMAIHA
ncbi:hypothetical protein BC827DRAFT_265355 [Russula dissimulans]|nr:hypothetical protein BC827DRAFT_265355 [Russula dissimulans]